MRMEADCMAQKRDSPPTCPCLIKVGSQPKDPAKKLRKIKMAAGRADFFCLEASLYEKRPMRIAIVIGKKRKYVSRIDMVVNREIKVARRSNPQW